MKKKQPKMHKEILKVIRFLKVFLQTQTVDSTSVNRQVRFSYLNFFLFFVTFYFTYKRM